MTAATGCVSLAEANAGVTLAACPIWATICELGEDESAQHIFYYALPPPASGGEYEATELDAYRPYCVVSTRTEDGHTLTRDTGDPGFPAAERGALVLYFELPVTAELRADPAELMRVMTNYLGAIKGELIARAGTAGNLDIREIAQWGPYLATQEEVAGQGDYCWFILQLRWGGN